MIQGTLSGKDIFIMEIMLEANKRKLIVTRKEVEACADFYMKISGYLDKELILNTLDLAISSGAI